MNSDWCLKRWDHGVFLPQIILVVINYLIHFFHLEIAQWGKKISKHETRKGSSPQEFLDDISHWVLRAFALWGPSCEAGQFRKNVASLNLAPPTSPNGEGNGTPLQHSCLENPMDGGAWWSAVHGVARSGTQLSDFTLFFHFHALGKEMATHSSILAWRIPWMEEPGGLHLWGLTESDMTEAT